MIEHAIEILQKTGFDFTARELAEIFWLAVYLDEGEQDSSEEKEQVESEQDSSQEKQQIEAEEDSSQEKQQLNPKQDSFQKTQPQKVPITLPQTKKSTPEFTQSKKGISIKVPAAPALRNTLELGRALRPLMRKVSSPTEKILDEEATVYRSAEQDVWVPVFQPKPQRWLELALVVEKSNSIAIWKPTIRELEQLLKYHGGFRDVKTWELKVTPKTSELFPLKLSSQSSKNINNSIDNNSTSYSPDILIDATPFHFGETITGELANYRASRTFAYEPSGKYRGKTTPAGQFPPNGFGLHDMHGNVYEWCFDDYHHNYEGAPTDGSAWVDSEKNNDNYSQVWRGGSWISNPENCRSARRSGSNPPLLNLSNIGLRVVCDIPPNTLK